MTKELLEALSRLDTLLHTQEPMTSAVHKVLLGELPRMLRWEAGCRQSADPLAIYHMRVSSRRIRSLIRLFRPYFLKKQVKPIRVGLRMLSSRLGTVRDLDVFQETIQSLLEESIGEVDFLARMKEQLFEARCEPARELQIFMRSEEYQGTLQAIRNFLRAEPLEPMLKAGSPYELRHLLPITVQQQLAKVYSYDAWLNSGDIQTLHDLRIEIKGLRYILTFFSEVLGPTSRLFIAELKRIQDNLGVLSDISSAQDISVSLRENQTVWGSDTDFHVFEESLQTRAKLSIAPFEQNWQRLKDRRVRKYLSDALLVL